MIQGEIHCINHKTISLT